MSDDFVRCYIGDITLSTLRNVQRESGKFDEWELIQGSDFDRKKSYGYKEGIWERDESLVNAFSKRSVIAQTRQPESVKPSFIWNNALNIADVLTMLSIARARYLSASLVEKELGTKYTISRGIFAPHLDGRWDIVPLEKLGNFVSQTLDFIEQNSGWLVESGFHTSIIWYTQAQVSYLTAPSILEMGLYWVSMETLANAYLDSVGLKIQYKKEQVKRFILDRGYSGSVWDFLDEVIDDWYSVRNDLFHEGKQKLSVGLLSKRRQQVRDFTSLVLVEMLQPQGEERQKLIAERMQSY